MFRLYAMSPSGRIDAVNSMGCSIERGAQYLPSLDGPLSRGVGLGRHVIWIQPPREATA